MVGSTSAEGLSAYAGDLNDSYDIISMDQQRRFPPAILSGWSIGQDGFSVFESNKLGKPTGLQYIAAWQEVYPRPLLFTWLFTDGHSARADNVAMKFHHWMAWQIPGYWNMFYYREAENASYFPIPAKEDCRVTTAIRIKFPDNSQIVLYGAGKHSKKIKRDGPVLSRISTAGVEDILLYHSPASNEICYPEHRHRPHVSFGAAPSFIRARAIVEVFAMISAIGTPST